MSPATVTAARRAASGTKLARDHTAGRPLKNPLRIASAMPLPAPDPAPVLTPVVSAPQLRRASISQFGQWLRTQTNKYGRPYSERCIQDYTETARALDRWMTAQDIDADFTACDTGLLNRFFADYFRAHTQGGTNTRQRNLHHLFKWLAKTQRHPDPWTQELVRYGPAEVPPSTLAEQLIRDLLEVTGSGLAGNYTDARDHALIRMLTEGPRREEVAQQEITDLPENLIESPFLRVVPLKGDRARTQGRIIPLSMATANAMVAYLRLRKAHRLAGMQALWLGPRGPMTGSGIYQMLHRRTREAGYEPIVRPHQFRHTFAHDWLDGGGTEGDLMRLMGWSSRSMVDRYAKDLQLQRAIKAKRERGDMY